MKRIFMVVILLTTVLLSFSQSKPEKVDDKKKSNWIVAPVIGLNYSGITGSTGSGSYKYILGAQLGFIVNVISFNQNFGLRAEANFSMMGGQSVYAEDVETVHINYLNIPVVTRYQSTSGFFGEAGLQPGFLLSAKLKAGGTKQDYKSSVESFDFGIPFGGGYEFKNHIGVGLRLVPSVTEVYKYNSGHHNFVGSLRATYSF